MQYVNIWQDIPMYNEKYAVENPENINTPSITPFLNDDGKKRPALIVVPGGGYTHRATEKKAKVCEHFKSWDINVFMLHYRVFPYMHPVEINDCRRAIRYIKYNADKYNIDKDKISLIGFSAGAHLAAISVLTDKYDFKPVDDIDKENTNIYSAALCYPVISLCEDYAHKGSAQYLAGDNEDLKKSISIEKMDLSKMPEVFMWHTFEDMSVSVLNSIEMAKRLKKENINFEYHIFPKGRHGSALAENIEGTKNWSVLYKDWLSRIGFL